MRSTFQEQLSVLSKPKPRKKNGIKDPSPSPMEWIEDGVDHINILRNGKTSIGDFLAHGAKFPFTHNVFGKFSNMESFWYYIQSTERDDRIRVLTGKHLTSFKNKLTTQRVKNFRAIIMDSNWQKIKQYKEAVASMRDSELPFDCYGIDSNHGIRIRPIYFKWLLSGFEEIRRALKENREPDFTFLIDEKDSGIYDFCINKREDFRTPESE